MMVAASDEFDARGMHKYASVIDDIMQKIAQDEMSDVPDVTIQQPVVKNPKAKAQRKVQSAMNLAYKATHGKYYYDESWQGVREFENIVAANVDEFHGAVRADYSSSRANGDRDVKEYTFRVKQDGFLFDFDLTASEEGSRGGYQVWAMNLRKVRD